ncbi:DUF4097 family beta strand repeat-containing protein [Risungbinella massiliensis]|uniref:DUF4097 family beta strand repeat-containing protein n=1 Tax=Risungbinella massiliensis TaxID=1329796 RepID=UPI0005CBAD9E|nr:DUF4097 family beta strand repeat-containing protein [Risungbinella massiliensis]
MRTSSQPRMFWTLTTVLGVALTLSGSILWFLQSDTNTKGTPQVVTKTIPLDGIQNISIQTDVPDVIILPNSSSQIQIRYTTYSNQAQEKLEYQLNDDQILLEVQEKAHLSANLPNYTSTKKAQLEIKLPITMKQLEVRSTTGNITFQDAPWHITNANLRSIDGTVTAKGISANSLKVYTVTGKQSLSRVKLSDELDLSSSNGELEISEVTAKKISAKTVSGNMNFQHIDAKLQADTTNGTIQPIYFQKIHDGSSISSLNGDIEVIFSSEIPHMTIEARTTSGMLQSDFPDYEVKEKSEKHHFYYIGSPSKAPKLQIVTTSGNLYLHYPNENGSH